MTLRPTIGSLDPNCKQASWWREVYGSLDMPLKSMIAHQSNVPGTDEPEHCYYVDLTKLTDGQIDKICEVMAREFNVPIDVVRSGVLGDHGVPVLAKHLTTVSFDGRHFL